MTKKIFIAADIHDDKEALARFTDYAASNGADIIMIAGDLLLRPYEQADLVAYVNSNDATTFVEKSRESSRTKLNEMKTVLDKAGVPYAVVPGNYDPPIDDVFDKQDIHLKAGRLEEALIAGYGGADAFPQHIGTLMQAADSINIQCQQEAAKEGTLNLALTHAVVMYNEAQMLNFFTTHNPDVILTHNPPHCLCDTMFNNNQVGSAALTRYLRTWRPKLVISGHIHESGPLANNPRRVNGISGLKYSNGESTTVLNPGNLGRFELISPQNLSTQKEFSFGTFVSVSIEADGTPTNAIQYSLADERNIGKNVRVIAGGIDKNAYFQA